MSHVRSRFAFDSRQRSGILLLVLCILLVILSRFFIDFTEEEALDLNSEEVQAIQQEIECLKQLASEAQQPKIYPFNPNFMTAYRAYVLGVSPAQLDKLKSYRSEDRWIHSASQFQEVTGVSDSLLETLRPWFSFPQWVTSTSYQRSNYKKPIVKQDLNTATASDLTIVNGIGETLAGRIVSFRDRLGGFQHPTQLYDVYGLSHEVVTRTLEHFEIQEAKPIEMMDINSASASDLATIPGISFNLAKSIWEFRVLHERIDSLPQLRKIEGVSERKIQLIKLYLYIE